MIVVDASFVVHLLIGVNGPDASAIIIDAETIAAPAVLDFEVLSGIRRAVFLRRATEDRARIAIANFYKLRVERYFMEALADRIWALKANATVYYASYLALAERLGAPFYTLDRKLAAVPGCDAEVVVL